MTVKDLIAEMQKFNPDMMVVVNGHEYGFNELTDVSEIKISLNVNFDSWAGKHDSYDHSDINALFVG